MNNKNNNLEVVRGLAAFAVVICHVIDKIPELSRSKNHFTNLFANWGTESVMIFFILSGIVIHSSFEKRPRSSRLFLIQRVGRLHPALILSIGLSIITSAIVFNNIPSVSVIVGNLLPVSTLGNGIVPVLYTTNPVIWSLSFEVFFYAVFGLFIIKEGQISGNRILIWLSASVLSIGVYYLKPENGIAAYLTSMFAFSTIWLIGFYIWSLKDRLVVSLPLAGFSLGLLPLISRLHLSGEYFDPVKYVLFSIASIPLFCYLISAKEDEQSSALPKNIPLFGLLILFVATASCLWLDGSYNRTIKLAYIILPLIISLTFYLPTKKVVKLIFIKLINPLMSFLGKLSYSLYLFHFPIIILLYNTLQTSLGIKIAIIIATTLAISYLLEVKFQPVLTRIFFRKGLK